MKRYLAIFFAAALLLLPSCRRDDTVTPEQAKEEREQEKREVDGEVSAHGWDDGGDTDYNEQGND